VGGVAVSCWERKDIVSVVNGQVFEKWCQTVCYLLAWIYDLRESGPNDSSVTHNTPHTNLNTM